MKRAIDREANRLGGHATGKRHELTRADLERDAEFSELVEKAMREVFLASRSLVERAYVDRAGASHNCQRSATHRIVANQVLRSGTAVAGITIECSAQSSFSKRIRRNYRALKQSTESAARTCLSR